MAPRALARTLPKITRAALAKRGAAFAALIADWHNAVGPALAESSLPERLTRATGDGAPAGGVLTVRVASGGAALEFQHAHTQLVERINGYLGFAAVARIVIRQAPLPPGVAPAVPPPAKRLSPADTQDIAAVVATVEDDLLRSTLERLGRGIATRRQIDEE